AQYTLQVALRDAELIPKEGADSVSGEALEELARQYVTADSVIARLSRIYDAESLSAMAEGVHLVLDDEASATESAARLQEALENAAIPNGVNVKPQFDDVAEEWSVVVNRMHHGNVRVSVFDQ